MSSPSQSSHRHLSPGVIAAIVIGAIVFILVVFCCTCCCWFITHFEPCGTTRLKRRAAMRRPTEWTLYDRSRIRHWWEFTERDLEIIRFRQSGVVNLGETAKADRNGSDRVADLGTPAGEKDRDVEIGLELESEFGSGSGASTIVEKNFEVGDGEMVDPRFREKTASEKQ